MMDGNSSSQGDCDTFPEDEPPGSGWFGCPVMGRGRRAAVPGCLWGASLWKDGVWIKGKKKLRHRQACHPRFFFLWLPGLVGVLGHLNVHLLASCSNVCLYLSFRLFFFFFF